MNKNELDTRNLNELQSAFERADVILHKEYLGTLEDLEQTIIVNPPDWMQNKQISKISRFYHIDKLTYDTQENILEKLSTVFNAEYYYGGTLAMMIHNDGSNVQYYLGVVSKDDKDIDTNAEVLATALQGNFIGSEIKKLKNSEVEMIFENNFAEQNSHCVSTISGVASDKIEDLQEDEKFVQGIEKLIDATRGQVYTLLVLADPITKPQMQTVRASYEMLYSQLAPFEKTELTFNSTDSLTLTEGTSKNFSESVNYSLTQTAGNSQSESTGWSKNESHSNSHTDTKQGKKQMAGKTIGAAGGALAGVGGIVIATGGLATIPLAAIAAGSAIGAVGSILAGYSESDNVTKSNSTSKSGNYTNSVNHSTGQTQGESKTIATGTSKSTAAGQSRGQTLQITSQNRSVKSLLDRIDSQLERLEQCENFGVFNCAAYVISNNPSTNHTVASTYSALMRGEESGLETSAVNTWYEDTDIEALTGYLSKGYHPEFQLQGAAFAAHTMQVTPASMVSSRELAIHMGLPKKSIPGLPVVEMTAFGRNVYKPKTKNKDTNEAISLGQIYHMGQIEPAKVQLDLNSLSMHTFITGSTGTGKSNTIYQMLSELENKRISFLIIEPAKGEYKHMFGNRDDVAVFGTNPYYTPLLKINPFKFPEGIHVLEHVDRLVEIFNVCWPMYAAMPAVLKDAVLRAYEASGWNLITSKNEDGELYPTFADVLQELDYVINHSAYSADTKGDYIGSLATRLNSLTNGLNGQIFVNDEVDNEQLFDEKTIVDLSRVGSQETKALLMGILVMRLSEHRMVDKKGMNQPLRHVTVLEEAHNILKRTSTEQSMEGSNMAGKSVEMISNAIAEMRTYGEGFIIADQSPNAVDISAIRNTNTKIIMRLPDKEDRELAGKAAALKDEQLDEIAKLPKGVAVVYQNDWLEPVLCQIAKFEGKEELYQYEPEEIGQEAEHDKWFKQELLKLLVKGRVHEQIDVDIDRLQAEVFQTRLAAKLKRSARDLLNVYQASGKLELWDDTQFAGLSAIVVDLMDCQKEVEYAVKVAPNFEVLDSSLANIIQQQFESVSDEMRLTLSQCMMKQYSLEKEENINIYAAWRKTVTKRGVQ